MFVKQPTRDAQFARVVSGCLEHSSLGKVKINLKNHNFHELDSDVCHAAVCSGCSDELQANVIAGMAVNVKKQGKHSRSISPQSESANFQHMWFERELSNLSVYADPQPNEYMLTSLQNIILPSSSWTGLVDRSSTVFVRVCIACEETAASVYKANQHFSTMKCSSEHRARSHHLTTSPCNRRSRLYSYSGPIKEPGTRKSHRTQSECYASPACHSKEFVGLSQAGVLSESLSDEVECMANLCPVQRSFATSSASERSWCHRTESQMNLIHSCRNCGGAFRSSSRSAERRSTLGDSSEDEEAAGVPFEEYYCSIDCQTSAELTLALETQQRFSRSAAAYGVA